MGINGQKPKILKAVDLFIDTKYLIPIYQRNYAWGYVQIQQLIDDINSAEDMYFIGNLIVNQKGDTIYEVIDGQQRLTTLYILLEYLQKKVDKGSLCFEARKKSNQTLQNIATKNAKNLIDDLESKEIVKGYKIIENYFQSQKIDIEKFEKNLEKVKLVRIQVPPQIDLNHYFEIMNTRGEQLELHEIAKAKLIEQLKEDEDKTVGAIIWDACSNMESYIQMNIDVEERSKIFGEKWDKLDTSSCFDKLKEVMKAEKSKHGSKSMITILKEQNKTIEIESQKKEQDNERFESIISFPNFILQVNQAMKQLEERESMLDDKHLLSNIKENWENEESSKKFLFNLFKARFLFDKYILKREFAKDYKDVGRWSLQRLEAYQEKKEKYQKPKYIGTFGDDDKGKSKTNYEKNKKIRTLQSCLRITYTSPKTMHWISLLLKQIMNDEKVDVLNTLENYCRQKIEEGNYLNTKGFKIERIIFTYLDYILYRDIYIDSKNKWNIDIKNGEWQFIFRNSIEHFYPQNPSKEEALGKWKEEDLDGFGNLALITTSGNSKFSNLPPSGKIESFQSLVKQSLKLQIMEKQVRNNGNQWNKDIAQRHGKEMLDMLKEDINKKDKNR